MEENNESKMEMESTSDETTISGDTVTDTEHHLLFRVDETPNIPQTLLLAFQNSMLCVSGLVIFPFIVSEMACAGKDTVPLRVSLIAATFVACGTATLLQSTFGLRLALLHGTSLAFLPPLIAYKKLAVNECHHLANESVPTSEWMERLQTIGGSMMLACISFLIIGAIGAVGSFSRHVGPITIVPLLISLSLSTVPTIQEKLALHWISAFQLCALIIITVFLEDVKVPFPVYSFKKRRFTMVKIRIFSQFPYLLAITISWILCLILTKTDAISADSYARTDRNETSSVLITSPWFQVPYPGQFGWPKISAGLCMGYFASCVSSVIENVGSYKMAARVSEESTPPKSAVNRGILVEGIGSILAGSFGAGAGVTTYAESMAVIQITRVASRVAMQIAGIFCISLGLFTKMAALLASMPEPLVGGILCLGMSMITGVAMSNLISVNMKKTRNLAIMGVAIIMGQVIPRQFDKHPLQTGQDTVDQVMNMLLRIEMLIGGSIAFILDNIAPGASRSDRGFPEDRHEEGHSKGWDLPEWFERILDKSPILRRLPFLPSGKFKRK